MRLVRGGLDDAARDEDKHVVCGVAPCIRCETETEIGQAVAKMARQTGKRPAPLCPDCYEYQYQERNQRAARRMEWEQDAWGAFREQWAAAAPGRARKELEGRFCAAITKAGGDLSFWSGLVRAWTSIQGQRKSRRQGVADSAAFGASP